MLAQPRRSSKRHLLCGIYRNQEMYTFRNCPKMKPYDHRFTLALLECISHNPPPPSKLDSHRRSESSADEKCKIVKQDRKVWNVHHQGSSGPWKYHLASFTQDRHHGGSPRTVQLSHHHASGTGGYRQILPSSPHGFSLPNKNDLDIAFVLSYLFYCYRRNLFLCLCLFVMDCVSALHWRKGPQCRWLREKITFIRVDMDMS